MKTSQYIAGIIWIVIFAAATIWPDNQYYSATFGFRLMFLALALMGVTYLHP